LRRYVLTEIRPAILANGLAWFVVAMPSSLARPCRCE